MDKIIISVVGPAKSGKTTIAQAISEKLAELGMEVDVSGINDLPDEPDLLKREALKEKQVIVQTIVLNRRTSKKETEL